MKFFFKYLLSILIFFAMGLNASNLKSQETNLNFIKLLLINTIHENISIQSVGQWYLYITDKERYIRYKDDPKQLQDYVDVNYQNYFPEVQRINHELNEKYFYHDFLVEFEEYDEKVGGFPVSGLLKNGSYFIVDSKVENSFDAVARHYMKNANTFKEHYLKMPKSKVKTFLQARRDRSGEIQREIFVRYYMNITKIRLNDISASFLDSINALTIEMDIDSNIDKIEFLDLDKSPL